MPAAEKAPRDGEVEIEERLKAPQQSAHPFLTLCFGVGGIYIAYILYGLLQEVRLGRGSVWAVKVAAEPRKERERARRKKETR